MKTYDSVQALLASPEISTQLSVEQQQHVLRVFEQSQQPQDPLVFRILIAVSGWVAALFFLASLLAAGLFDKGMNAMGYGFLLLMGAIFWVNSTQRVFFRHLALALGIAGNGLVLFGMGEFWGTDTLLPIVVMQALLTGMSYPFVASNSFRFIQCILLGILVFIWLYDEPSHIGIIMWTWSLLLLQLLFFVGLRPLPALLPLAYAVSILLPISVLLPIWVPDFDARLVTIIAAVEPAFRVGMAVGLLLLALHISTDTPWNQPWFYIVVISCVILALFANSGLLLSLFILILAYILADRFLKVIAYLFLVVFLSIFYYNLQISLLDKSYLLMASGSAMLLVRWLLGLFFKEHDV
ncbi:DUF4401 domain-containing protein [Zooshikella marina]|uniref:DUF4401 domain-containing protein n=1 Tax=Zooshikella ganghwensis TaxID=202772 RepID=UPI0013FDE4E2|nr:DUF4401 domain-containing protein [Zooshikella ganghwensis]MBU2704510.1 DUF4401 domain-containing protein [Zooshikella ganghwensis]